MFGTIGHVRLKAGATPDFTALMDEWKRTIRPQIPGHFMELMGSVSGDPDQIVFVALAQDEATYRALAQNPDQHAWFERMQAFAEGDVIWEDVTLEMTLND
jgi:antibiotic biosynthesis monooxygenase (ABM) superfamily enzyme